MAAPILTTVKTEGATLLARLVGFLSSLVSVLTLIGLLSAEHGEKILGFINSPKTAAVVSLIGTLLVTFLPAIQGWRSKDKELPPGVTVKDVTVKPNAMVSPGAAQKLGMFIMACFMATVISACSWRASCPAPPPQPLAPPPPPAPPVQYQLAKMLVFAFMGAMMLGGLAACKCSTAKGPQYYSTNAYPAQKLQQMRAQQGQ